MAVQPGWQGRYFEDFAVGDIYRHNLGRTITQTDNTWFTLLTMNTNPSHFDVEYAKSTPFGKPLINSCLTLAIVTGQSVTDVSENAVANLGWDEVRMPNPLFAGDTLYAESEVLELRESGSRAYAGIVRIATRGMNQDGTIVIDFKRTIMVYRRGQSPKQDLHPASRTPAAEA